MWVGQPRYRSSRNGERRGLRAVVAITVALCAHVTPGATSHAAEEEQQAPDATGACLAWDIQTPSGCPSVKDLEAAVEVVLSQPVFSGERCDMKVRGAMTRLPSGGWAVDLSFATRDGASLGDRHLVGHESSCDSLRGPVALIIALMVEAAEHRATLSEPAPAPPISTSAPLGGPAARESVSSQRAGLPGIFAVSEVLVTSGLLPGAGGGALLGLGASPWTSRWSLRLEGTFLFAKSTVEGAPGARFVGTYAALALCPRLGSTAAVGWAVCAAAAWGTLHASGVGLDDNASVWRTYGHAELRVAATTLVVGPLSLAAHLGVAAPWIRPRFVYLDGANVTHELHRPEAIIPFAGLGFEWRLVAKNASQSDLPPSP